MGEILQNYWVSVMEFLPNLIIALFVFIIGWFAAIAVGKVVSGILYRLRFNEFFSGEKWEQAMKKADIRINPSVFLGDVMKWVVFVFAIWATLEILDFAQFAEFMAAIVLYLPNVIMAIIFFVVAVMVGEFLSKMAIAGTERTDFPYSKTVGLMVKVAIWIFVGFAILVQLEIAKELILAMFNGMIAFLVIAGGISFGLGGQDAAKKFIERIKKMVK